MDIPPADEKLFRWAINHNFSYFPLEINLGFLDIVQQLTNYYNNYQPQGELLKKAIRFVQHLENENGQFFNLSNSRPLFKFFEAYAESITSGNVQQFKDFLQQYDIDPRLSIPGLTEKFKEPHTALLLAAKNGSQSIPVINVLLADPRIPGGSAKECHQAIQELTKFSEPSANQLMQKFNQNNTDKNGETLLMIAVKNNDSHTVLDILHHSQYNQPENKSFKGFFLRLLSSAYEKRQNENFKAILKVIVAASKHVNPTLAEKLTKEELAAREKFLFGLKVAGLVVLGLFGVIGLDVGISLLVGFTPVGILATAAALPWLGTVLLGVGALGLLIAGAFGIKMAVNNSKATQDAAAKTTTTSLDQHSDPASTGDGIAQTALAVHDPEKILAFH